MRKILKISFSSTSSVCLDLDLCDPASSQWTTTEQQLVGRTASAHGTPHLHWNCSQSSREQLGKRLPFGKELDWKHFNFKTTSNRSENIFRSKSKPTFSKKTSQAFLK